MSDEAPRTLYDVLGVRRDASVDQIEVSYRAAERRYRPAMEMGDADAERELNLIRAAYEVLSDPRRRAAYDRSLDQGGGLQWPGDGTSAGDTPTPATPQTPRVFATLGAAARLIRKNPRATLLPFAVIQIPLSILTAAASAILYLTVFADEPYPDAGVAGSFVDLEGGQLFAMLIVFGVGLVFSSVGQAATVVAVAAAARGRPIRLVDALDPAFSRMGVLVMMAVALLALTALAILTLVGIILLPYFAIRFGLWLNVLMIEDVSVMEALRRSWALTHRRVLRFLGVVLLAFLAALVLVLGTIPAIDADAARNTRIFLDSIFEVFRGALLVPALVFVHTATTIFYLGVRATADADGHPA